MRVQGIVHSTALRPQDNPAQDLAAKRVKHEDEDVSKKNGASQAPGHVTFDEALSTSIFQQRVNFNLGRIMPENTLKPMAKTGLRSGNDRDEEISTATPPKDGERNDLKTNDLINAAGGYYSKFKKDNPELNEPEALIAFQKLLKGVVEKSFSDTLDTMKKLHHDDHRQSDALSSEVFNLKKQISEFDGEVAEKKNPEKTPSESGEDKNLSHLSDTVNPETRPDSPLVLRHIDIKL